ncbi:bifunctional DNA-formamidopyrimidine glycosylase/DNA-(apurinic or apyrimidinic site) lyase [Corynebacterium mendelii]|uniref:Formamidopyrimidine-DNA glycosylase n=1 Tax=Corynebacterium mendelii TaxID=2765362 RepID=A0A939IWL2_9CORY|nr:bifunctional DNA-formamidopyrimidine glycosylase/DNA-(apurinic or apyrimidinic site) lyase [Corynebacterium mendelii]MBN9643148.1 bifunctional DNA-formamidopyrimidine glycosylase/DNA-(apurinic or apyrimidinic site) lyase [Corynebacterium mendelii]
MPELPEVETIRRGLAEHITGCTISHPEIIHHRTARRTPGGAAAISQSIDHTTITAVERRGKFMWLVLDGSGALVVHLGMSGQMLIKPPRSQAEDRADPGMTHLRARMTVTAPGGAGQARQVWFVDQRTFGYWHTDTLIPADGRLIPSMISHIAPDPMEECFSPRTVAEKLKQRRSAIKPLLLNQEIVSGIGNIYADEMLFAAGIHPQQAAHRLSLARLERLLQSAATVMGAAIAQGGTSFDDLYVNVNGSSGYFDRSLTAYGRAGQPCLRCGTPLAHAVVGGRGSSFCPVCQKRH